MSKRKRQPLSTDSEANNRQEDHRDSTFDVRMESAGLPGRRGHKPEEDHRRGSRGGRR